MRLFRFVVTASIGGAMGAVCGFRFDDRKPKQPKGEKKGGKTNMKMENTSMEFVTFDAQDVIATSGGISFKVTSSLFDLGTGWQHQFDSYWVSPNHGFGDFAIKDSNGHALTDGQYYTIAEGAKYGYAFSEQFDGSYGGNLTFNSGLTAGNTGAEEKTSLSSILDWLKGNGVAQ